MTGTCNVVFGLLSDLGMVKMKEWIENLLSIRRLDDRRRMFCLCCVLALQSQGRSVQHIGYYKVHNDSDTYSKKIVLEGPNYNNLELNYIDKVVLGSTLAYIENTFLGQR
jgi:hypothetical protein